MKSNTKYTHRFVTRCIIEAATPLSIGTGEKDIITDQLVARDINGMPYIPGTTLAGIFRHAIDDRTANDLFGFQDSKNGMGSQIIFTSAHLVGENGTIIDGLQQDPLQSNFYEHYRNLPVRQHVRINYKGTNENTGKFDEQVIFKGSRFCFEIELLSDGKNQTQYEEVLSELFSNTLRIGGGSRSGFGEIMVVECHTAYLDLTKQKDLEKYLNKTSSLNDTSLKGVANTYVGSMTYSNIYKRYQVMLEPEDYFLIGSGFGNNDADITPVTEQIVTWDHENKGSFSDDQVLIPASSVKGCIAHRLAFHYNKLNGQFADRMEVGEFKMFTGSNNKAVNTLFGSEDSNNPKRGHVLISDIIEAPKTGIIQKKLLNHVSIDRFTGGTIDGALFTEEIIYGKNQAFELNILVHIDAFPKDDPNIEKAFNLTLKDIVTGHLPIGGGTNRGNGIFSGKVIINKGEEMRYE